MWTELTDSMFSVLLDAVVKGTAVLLLASAASLALRHRSAAVRHLVWASSLLALLALPMMSHFLPAWSPRDLLSNREASTSASIARSDFARSEVDGSISEAEVDARQASSEVAAVAPVTAGLSGRDASLNLPAPAEGRIAIENERADFSLSQSWLVTIWLAGALPSLLWVAGGWLSLRRLKGKCTRVEHGPLQQTLVELGKQLGIRRSVQLFFSSDRQIPMTWGSLRPAVLLPEDAQQWTESRVRMVLTHELAHVRRWDCLVQTLAHLARGFHWFHPLAWLAVRQLRIEQEQASDDLVLASGIGAPDYAESLLAVTAGRPSRLWLAPMALGMGRSTKIQQRLINLLDGNRDHRPISRRAASAVAAVCLACLLPLASAAFIFSPRSALADEPKAQADQAAPHKDAMLKKLNEVREKLAKNYVGPLDDKTLAEHALKGLLQGLKDPYTDYLSTEELEQIDKQLSGKLSGVGAQLKLVNDRLTVVTPLDGSPALKAGLRPDDIIDAINGKPTRGQPMNELVQQIVGPAGSVVKLKIIHPDGATDEIPVTRGEIRIRTAIGFRRGADGSWQYLLDPNRQVGYVRILQFSHGTAAEVRDAVKSLQKSGLKGLILDLRSCPGGLLDQSLDVCKLFLDKGTILSTRGPGKEERVFKADGKGTLGDFPLLILINEQTASAAEIVAGSLHDNERAILLGTRTFGKGSVQSMLKLDEGGALKMTTAHHYLPSGRNIQKRPGEKTWGIDPTNGFYFPLTPLQIKALNDDVQRRSVLDPKKDHGKETPLSPKEIQEMHSDPQLAAALRSMVARITGGEFLKVGIDQGSAQAVRIEELRDRREELQRSLNQLDNDIVELLNPKKPNLLALT